MSKEIKPGLGDYKEEALYLRSRVLAAVSRFDEPAPRKRAIRQLPGYVGMGTESVAFKARNQDTVLKLGMTGMVESWGYKEDEVQAFAKASLEVLQRNHGLARVEQLRAFDLDLEGTPVLACEYIPGPTLDVAMERSLLPTERRPYRRAIQTWQGMVARSTAPDGAPQNVIVGERDLFFIDALKSESPYHPESPLDIAVYFASRITPGYPGALTFRDACAEEFGPQAVEEIHASWAVKESRSQEW